jgi:hypothetical protein
LEWIAEPDNICQCDATHRRNPAARHGFAGNSGNFCVESSVGGKLQPCELFHDSAQLTPCANHHFTLASPRYGRNSGVPSNRDRH